MTHVNSNQILNLKNAEIRMLSSICSQHVTETIKIKNYLLPIILLVYLLLAKERGMENISKKNTDKEKRY
jgi:hypothetical protein